MILVLSVFMFLSSNVVAKTTPDWSANASLAPGQNRENIYQLEQRDFEKKISRGLLHTYKWPIPISGLFIPYRPLEYFLESDQKNPLQQLVYQITKSVTPFKNMESLYDWLGLNPFNDQSVSGIYQLPYPDGYQPNYPMGASVVDTKWGKGLTFSCATCHTSSLFGKTVMGLTNKRVRANAFFHLAKKGLPYVGEKMFSHATGADQNEQDMFARSKVNLKRVGSKKPAALGLDTSLAQVAISLSYRNQDPYATRSKFFEIFPRKNDLTRLVADSKPAVWWTLKYKTRWLSDGSIISGNPIFTNFLWNEIGRGTDLKELEHWLKNNQQVVEDLTAAVFSTKPPMWLDFFPEKSIDIARAKKGEKVFKNNCMSCHGMYKKGWSSPDTKDLTLQELIQTSQVFYHQKTRVVDVGTDPGRYQGTKHFAESLNDLAISKWMKTVIEPQKGYVPPPLNGIWSRYPYLHNNSIPNLCALMTPPSERPKTFIQGPANNIEEDYDWDCLGYPTGENIPEDWLADKDAYFNTKKEGLSNQGHYQMFLDDNGNEKLSKLEKRNLIEFLKTL